MLKEKNGGLIKCRQICSTRHVLVLKALIHWMQSPNNPTLFEKFKFKLPLFQSWLFQIYDVQSQSFRP